MPAVSVRDVAARAGVSVGTVSNVLNHPDKVSRAAAERVHAAIRELGFVRNDAARQLRAGRSRTIGLIVLDAGNPFFTDLARGAEEEAARRGLSVLLGNSDEDPTRERAYLDLFEEQRAHGVLLSPIGDVSERIARLRERGIPVVLVDRLSDDPGLGSVSVDDVAGGRLAVEHLLGRGRRHIAFVGGSLAIRQVADRLAGARAAVEAHGGARFEVFETDALTVLEGRRAGTAIAQRAAGERPDAVFAANDLVATGVLQALAFGSPVRVPEDVALIGYDDIDFAMSTVVPLSSIRQPSAAIGATAVRVLLEEARDPGRQAEHVVFQPELVARASTDAG